MMWKPTFLVALSALFVGPSTVLAYPPFREFPLQQKPAQPDCDRSRQRAEAVRDAFLFAWDGYYKYAFPNDELHPVDNGSGNSRNGWGASAVDALSTALIMELPEVVDQILDHIATIDYSQTDTMVSLFETTIRYLGGMISGYDLLKGPLSHLSSDSDKVETLLTQSANLANVMAFAFDTSSGVPYNILNITDKTNDGSTTNGIATIGTLILEWTRLSDLTGDDTYTTLVQGGEKHLLQPQPPEGEPFPGLIGHLVNIETGRIETSDISWGASHDSFYEYLIKMYVYDPNRFREYRERWIAAAESSIKYLKSTSRTASGKELTYLAKYVGGEYRLESEHLACFNGGNFILGGQVLHRPDLVDFGLKLVEGCYQTYHSTATRIGPETFGWDSELVPDSQKDFFDENGFYIRNGFYNLRPEVIESYYYAYRATGNPKYQDWAWEAFVAINATTRTGSGFTAIYNVNDPDGGRKANNQESFLFAEVLKYAYMIHVPDGDWNVATDGRNKWVYNTEAHPIRVFER
ncbi:hypothetical protein VTO42DRAFT_3000 [Malbranchea cinnamomea]